VINTYDAIVAFHSDKAPAASDSVLGNVISRRHVVMLWIYNRVVPLMPPRRRRPPQALLQTPRPLLALDAGKPLEHTAQAVRVDHPRTLMLTDFYIMLVASGTISDLRFIG